MHEKRKYIRVQPLPDEPVEVHLIGENFIDVLKAKDISEGGLGIYVEHDFDGCRIGNFIDIIIKLPGENSFKVKGKIIHKNIPNAHFFGVEFIEIDEKSKAKIRNYVRKILEIQEVK